MTEGSVDENPEFAVPSALAQRVARFLRRVESRLEITDDGGVPEPVRYELRSLQAEAHDLHAHVAAAGQPSGGGRPAPPVARRWLVKVDIPLVATRMSADDRTRYSAHDVRRFLSQAGFRCLDGFWSVSEPDLGHLEPDEVTRVGTEDDPPEPDQADDGQSAQPSPNPMWSRRAIEDRLDWEENHRAGAAASAPRMWLVLLGLLAVLGAAAAAALWLWLRRK